MVDTGVTGILKCVQRIPVSLADYGVSDGRQCPQRITATCQTPLSLVYPSVPGTPE